MQPLRIRTFYQADPAGVVPGGIDTFIRGLVKWAPEDFQFSLVGMSTDPQARPVGRWTRCSLGRRSFDFFPVFAEPNPGAKARVPWTLQLCWHAWRYRAEVLKDFDVLELHRIEPLLLFRGDQRPKNAFFHQDMSILRNSNADLRWKHSPSAYFWLEDRVVPMLDSAFCVREAGVEILRERFPTLAPGIHFVPTWVDTELFHPHETPEENQRGRAALRGLLGCPADARLIVTVGRIDSQKNPQLLLDAFNLLAREEVDVRLIYVGDGALRAQLESSARELGLSGRVHFMGLRPPQEIATILRAADVFALSSSYEGMPMALLEALGSGLPVVTTDVGEVRKAVSERCGQVVEQHDARALAGALRRVLDGRDVLAGAPCVRAIERYRPATVLESVYENYRRLAARGLSSSWVAAGS